MDALISDLRHEFARHRKLVERALAPLDDRQFFAHPAKPVNSIALIVKHLSGNLLSRWTDFLTTDGEKPDRNRDQEFLITERDSRESLMAAWERGWQALEATLGELKEADLSRTITIRGESQTAQQALLRGLTHVAYHTGQMMYLARMMKPESPWLTIAPGQSEQHRPGYRKP